MYVYIYIYKVKNLYNNRYREFVLHNILEIL